MILLLILFALLIGINFKYSIILCSILSIIIVVFTLLRFRKKIKVLIPIVFILMGVGLSFIKIDNKSDVYSGVVIETNTNYVIILSNMERLYMYSKDNTYEIGDWLSVDGPKSEISSSVIESGFDFKLYLEKKGVNYQLKGSKVEVNFSNPLRINAFRKSFLSHFNTETSELVNSVLFGKSGNSDVFKSISVLHLSKLISSSGLYLHAFFVFIVFVCSLFIKRSKSEIVGIVILVLYSIITFPRFSVIRYVFLLILRKINKTKLNNKLDFLTILGGSGLFFLLIDFHLGYTDSFILGFTIPLIIYFLRNALSRFKKIPRKIGQAIGILMFFIPFEIKFYNEINLLGYPLQLLLSPIFILFATTSFLCLFKIPIYGVPEVLTKLITNVTGNLTRYTLCIYYPEFNDIFIILYNLLYILTLYYLEIWFKPVLKVCIVTLFSFLTLYSLPINNLITEEVVFINVGQGDSCLIRKRNTTVLIDTGGSVYTDIANECLIPFFKKNRIYSIDLLITTHDDYDHSGAKTNLSTYFKVKNYINTATSFPLTINNIEIKNYNNYTTSASEENEKSLVLGFRMVNYDFLIMGDAPKSIENKIMTDYSSIPCDILKVGHHGSSSSTSDSFIKFIQPIEAVISVGKNYYGHPNTSVLNVLKKNKIIIHRTDKEGSIHYKKYVWS